MDTSFTRAVVYVYDSVKKNWNYTANVGASYCRIDITENTQQATYTVSARGRLPDTSQLAFSSTITKDTKYVQNNELFGQWADQKGFYGLKFASQAEAQAFSNRILEAIGNLNAMHEASQELARKAREMERARETKDEWWDLNIKDVDMSHKQVIGQGSYGVVYKARYRDQDVAVKQLKTIDEKQIEDFKREAALMVSLPGHPNCVRLFGVCLDENNMCIVTEYLELGALKNLLQQQPQRLNLMQHLHAENVVHRDLSARNILVTEGRKGAWLCKVADFGLSRIVAENSIGGKTVSNTGPLKWMAPEALLYKRYSKKSDSWSFGCFLIEVFTKGEDPYPLDAVQAASGVMHKNLRPSIPEHCPPTMGQLLDRTFERDPANRPEFPEILKTIDETEQEVLSNPFYN